MSGFIVPIDNKNYALSKMYLRPAFSVENRVQKQSWA